ncbi:MAG: flagellar FlbD family protein [Planctomycetes bacterium]|nr:flagellar FlbD family protein [Planctomycetota bacterium]
MIKLTRFNGKDFFINPEMIQFIEETPDTVITLINHDKVVIKEKADEVVQKIIEYARLVRSAKIV